MTNKYIVKLGYNEPGCLQTLGYNEHILGQIGHFNTQIYPVITYPGCNEPSSSLQTSLTVYFIYIIIDA
jgi:hypothetical protein